VLVEVHHMRLHHIIYHHCQLEQIKLVPCHPYVRCIFSLLLKNRFCFSLFFFFLLFTSLLIVLLSSFILFLIVLCEKYIVYSEERTHFLAAEEQTLSMLLPIHVVEYFSTQESLSVNYMVYDLL
jgi:hypothetical protein